MTISGPTPEHIEVTQVGDAIRVGGKYFKVMPVPGSIQESTQTLAKMAMDKLSSCSSRELKATAEAKEKIKLQFTESGTHICRMDGRVMGPKRVRSLPLFELYEVPPPVQHDVGYWKQSLSAQLKGHSRGAISVVLESIFTESHLMLLDVMEGRGPSEWGEKTIADLLQEPGNEELRQALLQLKQPHKGEVSPKEFKKCLNDVKIIILKNIQRSARVVPLSDGRKMIQQFVKGNDQLHNKIENESIISPEDIGSRGKGYPSEADKGGYRNKIINNNTNLAAVTTVDADNKPERVVVMRSGKSDTLARLEEHVLEACIQQLSCKDPRGLVCTEPGTYEFQHCITTYMDPSRLKALGETLATGSGESKYLKKLLEEVEKWPPQGIVVNIADDAGQLVQVTLKRPIICNQLLSSTVRGVGTSTTRIATMGQKESDEINHKANMQLLQHYPTDKPIGDIRQFLRSEMKGEHALLAKALYALFFQQGLHAADMEIMRNIALDKLNISKGKQCKSGTDRTAIGVALAVAQEKFEAQFGKTFLPTEIESKTELLYFKTFFREALKEMGISIVCETKGYSGLKWGGGIPFMGGIANPSAYKYLYLEEDLEPLADIGIHKELPDVKGLTYADLQKAGASQYKGTLTDPRAFHGKSDKKFAQELAEKQELLSDADVARKNSIQEIHTFFEKNLRLKLRQVVTDNLELSVHVRELELDNPIVQGGNFSRAQILKAYIEELSTRERTLEVSLELYALQQISSLWELVSGAHTFTVMKASPFTFTPPESPREEG